MRCYLNLRLISLLSIACATLVTGQDAKQDTGQAAKQDNASETVVPADPRSVDRSKIESVIESYVSAFNSKDVDKLVSHWAPDGVYISLTSGDQLTGHDALKEEFTAILSKDEAPKLACQTESIEFVSPNVAVERGSAVVSTGDTSDVTTYQVIYVERDGNWLIDRVSEDEVIIKASNYEHLKGLEFLVGQWASGGDGRSVDLDCQWTSNQNYLSRKYRVSEHGEVLSSGLQIIGWDAKEKQVRSWLFDSDGGFVKGEWSYHRDHWVVQSVATLADGASGSSTSIYTSANADSIAWRKIDRVVDGKLLPNTEEVILQRQ